MAWRKRTARGMIEGRHDGLPTLSFFFSTAIFDLDLLSHHLTTTTTTPSLPNRSSTTTSAPATSGPLTSRTPTSGPGWWAPRPAVM